MLFSLLSGGSFTNVLISLILTLPVVMFALSLHETAHGFVAWKCGDNTAYNLGRLTLNPMRHLDPLGTLFMIVFGFGWAKPVPINTRNFRNPKRGMALTAAAGPIANFLLAGINAVLLGFFSAYYSYLFYTDGGLLMNCIKWVAMVFEIGAYLNFAFAIFNLIPVPPFDGSRIALTFLPTKLYFRVMRYERQIMYGILIALLVSSYLFDFSPVSWVASKLTSLIEGPVAQGFWKLFTARLEAA